MGLVAFIALSILIVFACGHLGVLYGEYITRPIMEKDWEKLKYLKMFPVYGLGSLAIWYVSLIPIFQKPGFIWLLLILGMIVANIFELLSGLLLNKLLKLNIWDYSNTKIKLFGKVYPGHILGQIDWIHSVIWIVLTPVVIFICQIIEFLAKLVR